MKRSEFLSAMGKSLFKTVHEASAPLVMDQVNKLDSFVDDLAGLKWHDLGAVKTLSTASLHDFFILGKAIMLIYEKETFKAFEKVCLSCHMMPQWIAYEKKFKCMNCETEYYVRADSGELTFKSYPLRIEAGRLYVGVN